MADYLRPDLCVIGGGSGGLTAVAAARAFGASVVLVERGEMGGDCLNTGCVPSKALLAAAHHAEAGRQASEFGVTFADPEVSFKRVHDHVMQVITGIAPHDSVERFESLGAIVLREHARFIDARTLEAGTTKIRARRFIVAAGSRPAVPPIPGLDKVAFLTNETIFSLTTKPAHLIIIGGGPIGMELAQAHRRLGCAVTIVEMGTPLSNDDPDLTEIALRRIQGEGVDIRAKTGVVGVAPQGQGIAVTLKNDTGEETLTGSHLLIAAGRAPNVENLGLEAAGVSFGRRGINVDAALKSSNRRIYAVGDVAGGLQFTHVASYQASLVIRTTLFGQRSTERRQIVPWCTYTDPEIANVGMTEAQVREKYGVKFKVLRWPFAENDRARTEKRTDGLVKLIVASNGRILGCGIVGQHAGEMIALFAYAIANKQKVGSLLKFVAPYPTLSEMSKRVAVEYYREALASPWIKRWLGLIRLLP